MGGTHLWIPELRLIRALPPGPFHDAEKAIRPLHRDLVSLLSQHHHFGSIGNRTRCSTASQRDLGFLVRYQVLVQGSHRRIGGPSVLCNCLPTCVRADNLQGKCQSYEPDLIFQHPILPICKFRASEHRPRDRFAIVNWTKWAASSRHGAIHDSIIPTGQNQTTRKLSTVGNEATHSSSQLVAAKVLVNAPGFGRLFGPEPGGRLRDFSRHADFPLLISRSKGASLICCRE